MPVAVAVIEFSHVTKACASVPQMPVAGWSARGSHGLSGCGARVSWRKSQYRSAGTGRAQILVPVAVIRVRRMRRAAWTPAISRRCSGGQSGSYARSRSRSSRWRSSGSISALASSQSKARVRAGIVPLSRQARTIGLASAVAAYSRMVSCHQGSLTLSARLFTRSGVALTCRAARYSWNVRCVKAYRPAVASTNKPLLDMSSRNASPVTEAEEALKLGPEDLQDAVGAEVRDVARASSGRRARTGASAWRARTGVAAGPWPGCGAKAGPGRSPRRGRRGCRAARRGTGAPWRSSSAAADWCARSPRAGCS